MMYLLYLLLLVLLSPPSIDGGLFDIRKDRVVAVTVLSPEAYTADREQALLTLRTLRLHGGEAGPIRCVVVVAITNSSSFLAVHLNIIRDIGALNAELVYARVPEPFSELSVALNALDIVEGNDKGGHGYGYGFRGGIVEHVLYLAPNIYTAQDPLHFITQHGQLGLGLGLDEGRDKIICPAATFSHASLCSTDEASAVCQSLSSSMDERLDWYNELASNHQLCSPELLLVASPAWNRIGVVFKDIESSSIAFSGNSALENMSHNELGKILYEQLVLTGTIALLEATVEPIVLPSSLSQPAWLDKTLVPLTYNLSAGVASHLGHGSYSAFKGFKFLYANNTCSFMGSDKILSQHILTIDSLLTANRLACTILGGFRTLFPAADFLEIGGTGTSTCTGAGAYDRADVTNRGVSVSARGPSVSKIDPSVCPGRSIWTNKVTNVDLNVVSFEDIWKTYIEKQFGVVRYLHFGPDSSSLNTNPSMFVQAIEMYIRSTESGNNRDKRMGLPCFITFPAKELNNPSLNIEMMLMKLGLIVISLADTDTFGCDDDGGNAFVSAIGGHCTIEEFTRLRPLLSTSTLRAIDGALLPKTSSSTNNKNKNNNFGDTEDGGKTDIQMAMSDLGDAERKGTEVVVIDDLMNDELLALLEGRLAQISDAYAGSTSFFLPFIEGNFNGDIQAADIGDEIKDKMHSPRSLIEHMIMNVIGPTLLGDLEHAVRDGYLGAEWWIQSRQAGDPKEYHLDTAITWCRDNGWAKEFLPACHFYPTIGTVYYLTDSGGPTVVFNQSQSGFGVTPVLPKEVAIVHPKRNRLLAFDGKLYHGVAKSSDSNVRTTLLINYWRYKTAGEVYTPISFTDDAMIRKAKSMSVKSKPNKNDDENGDSGFDCDGGGDEICANINKPTIVDIPLSSFDRHFLEDFLEWRNQTIPDAVTSAKVTTTSTTTSSRTSIVRYNGKQNLSGRVHYPLYENDSYSSWIHWKIDPESNQITPTTLDYFKVKEWRASMPGGDPFS